MLAEARGISYKQTFAKSSPEHTCLLSIRVTTSSGERTICGTVYGQDARIVHIDGHHVDIIPNGHMVVTQHNDRPGIIGKVGTLLGDNGVNIGGMHVGREAVGTHAIMVIMTDENISADLLGQIRTLPGIETAQTITL